ncbi:DegT/DnrJ/EryC1/StrS aminotransferase [Alkalidesulfovibrio alkalitolerans DSM 16529]|uniref:DegT/DnrJ/EryC1/StrS aminotransferase n=1 Tax=Alkalidesulfovibrio alkalitolerans DSM 16529 TaxID=1121439 RepID=S7UV15_9BACT|nr:DegT/DnrJ/EryC1/StrS family aminotransferase [Alkalidesulfovibrio alkalitolerans]EPR36193.1 DegT/DnrJ/EryC1/StrS aminotransferase [Alkalidesulfovibrio alkalitolerans DSM 16529]
MIPHLRPTIEAEDFQAMQRVMSGRMLAEGALAGELARRLSALAGGAGGVACGSGTQALVLALLAAGVGTGCRVALPTYVCPSLLAAIRHVGARPVFCDIAHDLLLDPDQALAAAQTCEALIVPHILGRWRDFSALRGHKAVVIEDFAQFLCPGEDFPGLVGDLSIFSLQATKVLCAGEGGVVVAAEPGLVDRLADLKRIDGSIYALNLWPLSDLQAALGLAQLDRLRDFTARRARVAEAYLSLLRDLPGLSWPAAVRCMHFRFPVLVPEGRGVEGLMAAFESRGVAVRRPVDILTHRFEPGVRDEDFPVAREVWDRTLSLPIYPGLGDGELEMVLNVARGVLGRMG